MLEHRIEDGLTVAKVKFVQDEMIRPEETGACVCVCVRARVHACVESHMCTWLQQLQVVNMCPLVCLDPLFLPNSLLPLFLYFSLDLPRVCACYIHGGVMLECD